MRPSRAITARITIVVCTLAISGQTARGQGDDPVTERIGTAWEKFTELQETIEKLGERGAIVNQQADLEFQLAELRRTIGTMQAEVNTWRVHPTRWNNLQVEYHAQLQQYRRYETETIGNIEHLKQMWRQLNEQEIERAQQRGDNVKPLDRVGLTNRMQASRQKYLDSYRAARAALADQSDQPAERTQQLNTAIARLKSAGDAKQLASSDAFKADFVTYCGNQFFKTTKKKSKRSR